MDKKNNENIIKLCGKDSLGFPNALVIVENMIAHGDERDAKQISEIVIENASVNIFRTASFITIDLKYDDPQDNELKRLVDMLNTFCIPEYSYDENRMETPTTCITVCPREDEQKTYIVAIHATWNLQPSEIAHNADTVRFIVENRCFKLFEVESSTGNIIEND